MEEQIKEIVRITDEGIIFMDYLPADFSALIEYIEKDNCILIFDNNLKQDI